MLVRRFYGKRRFENKAGEILSDFAIENGFDQIINEPTHYFQIGRPTCIDLILTNQRYSFVDSGVVPSPDPHCRHQIVYGKLNYSVPCPPPYKRTFWKYNQANIHGIRESIRNCDWKRLFGILMTLSRNSRSPF